MLDLRDLGREALLQAFDDADDPKAVKRLVVALAYTDDVSVATISDRYGIPEQTCYTWLNRFTDQSIEAAIIDETSSGRPSKLGDEQWAQLREDLSSSPPAFGYDADEWTPALLRKHLRAEYDTSYSLGHLRRLLADLGI